MSLIVACAEVQWPGWADWTLSLETILARSSLEYAGIAAIAVDSKRRQAPFCSLFRTVDASHAAYYQRYSCYAFCQSALTH